VFFSIAFVAEYNVVTLPSSICKTTISVTCNTLIGDIFVSVLKYGLFIDPVNI
jgi:hypothetical protein